MNKKQKLISISSVIVIIIMNIIPPWKITTEGMGLYTVQPVGYHFIFLPPIVELENEEETESIQYHINLDVTRLIIQWITVLFVLAALLFITKDKVVEHEEEFEEW